MAASLGVTDSLVGAQVILVYLAAMLASLFAGSVVVQLGAMRTTQLSLLGSAVGLGLAAVPSVVVIGLASVMLGASYGLVNPATGQMLESATPPARRAMAFSIKQSALPVGGMLAGVMAPLLAVSLGWQAALWVMACAAVAGALALETKRRWFVFQQPTSGGKRSSAWRDVDVIWSRPALRYTCLAVSAFAGVQLVLTTYIVTILVQHAGIGLVAAGIALSFFNGGGMLGRFGWGLAADAIQSGSRVLAGMFGSGVLLLVAFSFLQAAWPIVLVYGFVAALGAVVVGWAGVFVSEVLRLAPPGEAARVIAGAYVFTFGGALSGLGLFLLGFQLLRDYGATVWILVAMASAGFLLSLKVLAILGAHADRPSG